MSKVPSSPKYPAKNEISPAEKLQQRLNDPKIIDGLNRLLDQLDTMTFAVESIDGLVRRGEVITESIAETVGEMKGAASLADDGQTADLLEKAPGRLEVGLKLADAAAAAVNVDELTKSKILEQLTQAETLETLGKLLENLPLAAFMLESLEGFVGRSETIIDSAGDLVKELDLGSIDLDTAQIASLLDSLPKLREAGEKLLASELMDDGLPKIIEAGVSMIQSGMMDPAVMDILGDLGKKAAETYADVASQPVEPIGGLFATLRATKDPDVQKTAGFAFAFAKAFAKHLK